MAEQIVLQGEFHYDQSYEFVRSWELATSLCDTSNGGFVFELRGFKEVKIQVYGTGTVIINTDDNLDPADLIRILEMVLQGPDGEYVKLRVEKVWPMQSTAYNLAVASLMKEFGVKSLNPLHDWNRMVKCEAARIRRIYAQEAHPKAGEIVPGSDEYRRTLEELEVLPRKEPLVKEQSS